MRFNSETLRCPQCKRRVSDDQVCCSHCDWKINRIAAREMAVQVERHRKFLFWQRVKDFLLGRRTLSGKPYYSNSKRRM